ncbi:hypothetical protein X975_09197, partial [Stegodyphus mimosarum]
MDAIPVNSRKTEQRDDCLDYMKNVISFPDRTAVDLQLGAVTTTNTFQATLTTLQDMQIGVGLVCSPNELKKLMSVG